MEKEAFTLLLHPCKSVLHLRNLWTRHLAASSFRSGTRLATPEPPFVTPACKSASERNARPFRLVFPGIMKSRKWILVLVAVVAAAGVLFWQRNAEARQAPAWRFVEVERGDIRQTISATGSLSAVTTVSVGTQVSGQIAELHVDFNDRVKEGQLLARIDPTLARQAVTDAEASLARARAQLVAAQRDWERNRHLLEQGLVAASAFDATQSSFEVARANVRSAEVAVERARQNLAYTSIHAPIDGVVVERNVDLGQTVAASLSAPQLFLIANDLAEMEILASVDESDIGRIQTGQTVRFTVQAYPDETFEGTVRQVRLQSTTMENVVNYTAVIGVRNDTGRLLPGMTASVEFMVETAENVLKVPNAALRFRPTEQMLAQVEMPTMGGARGDSASRAAARAERQRQGGEGGQAGAGANGVVRQGGQGGFAGGFAGGNGGARRPGSGAGRANFAMLWTVDGAGKVAVIPVRTGISDGTNTEIQGPGLQEGMQVIAGLNQTGGTGGTTNPFQNGGPGGPGGFRPGGF